MEPVPALAESMSIMPGQRYPGPIEQHGFDPRETPREGGHLYARMWCAVLEARPRFVTIADWNNFREETAIEDSYTWEDPDGRARTSHYTDMTRVYTELLEARLIEGVCYRAANETSVVQYISGRLKPVPRAPRHSFVHPVPPLLLEQLRNAP